MEVRAVAKFVRVQPRKVRIVADEIRGKSAPHAAALLQYHTSKGAKMLRKVLVSAMANAEENNGMNQAKLFVAGITVDEGPRLKRMQARAMGRGNRIIKKTSHITVTVDEREPNAAIKPHGTKAKVRPKFAAPKKKDQAPTVAAKAEAVKAEEVKAEEVVAEAAEQEVVEQQDVAETPTPENKEND